jgi:hypothetical protein
MSTNKNFISASLTLKFYEFNVDKFNKAVFEFGNRIIRKAGRTFCAEIYKSVPVWSGMALASIKPLARAVRFAVPIIPVEDAPDRRALGESLGGKMGVKTTILKGDANMWFNFNWETFVDHFNLNDQVDTNKIENIHTGAPCFHLGGKTMTGKVVYPPWHAVRNAMKIAYQSLTDDARHPPKPTTYGRWRFVKYNPKLRVVSGFVEVVEEKK